MTDQTQPDAKAATKSAFVAAWEKMKAVGGEAIEDIEQFFEAVWEEMEAAGLAVVHAVEELVHDVTGALHIGGGDGQK